MQERAGDATVLLQRMSEGDAEASEELLNLLYAELRLIAARCMGGERQGHTLEPTALVHEAWMRLLGAGESVTFSGGREHFVRLAARAMRRVLVDHARTRRAVKRGRGWQEVPLDGLVANFEERNLDLISLDAALEKLGEVDPDLARLVELRFFAGLTIAETARVLEVSTPTIERRWRVARMWLRREMPESS